MARSAQVKSKNRTYVFIEKAKKIHPATKIGNVSFAKPYSECEYDKIPTCLSRKCNKSNKWYCQCPSIYSNQLFKYFCHNPHAFLTSYCLGYCVKFKFTCKEKFL